LLYEWRELIKSIFQEWTLDLKPLVKGAYGQFYRFNAPFKTFASLLFYHESYIDFYRERKFDQDTVFRFLIDFVPLDLVNMIWSLSIEIYPYPKKLFPVESSDDFEERVSNYLPEVLYPDIDFLNIKC
jgi:hypothetical protein